MASAVDAYRAAPAVVLAAAIYHGLRQESKEGHGGTEDHGLDVHVPHGQCGRRSAQKTWPMMANVFAGRPMRYVSQLVQVMPLCFLNDLPLYSFRLQAQDHIQAQPHGAYVNCRVLLATLAWASV